MKHLDIIRLVPRNTLTEKSVNSKGLSKDAALLATAIVNIQYGDLHSLRPHVPLSVACFDKAAHELFLHGIVGDPFSIGVNDNE